MTPITAPGPTPPTQQTDDGQPAASRIERALACQRAALAAEGAPSAALRRNRIDRLMALLVDNADDFAAALNQDFGYRPQVASTVYEILSILPDLKYLRSHIGKWIKPRRPVRLGALGLSVSIEARPLGVVGIIGPWNFPVALVVQPAAAAFAAGNRVMIKFSEVTPATAAVFCLCAAKYFAPEELTVITGDAAVGAEFSRQQFDHLFFTGSPGVGTLVAQSAAANLVPVTLELGGKNPLVVARGADIDKVAKHVLAARLVNGGQVCLCPDYAWVPREDVAKFIAAANDACQRLEASTPEGARGISIVNDRNFQRIKDLIADADAHGANVIHLHSVNREPFDRKNRTIVPTIVLGVTDDMKLASEEVFGPVLTIFPYDSVDQIITYVQTKPIPLAAYWYGPQGDGFERFRRNVNSGGMTVGDFGLHCAMYTAPFGGVGRSGQGAYHGKAGFDTFTHHRTVAVSRLPVNFAEAITPPFAPSLTRVTAAMLRWERARVGRRLRTGRPPAAANPPVQDPSASSL
jgi:coniferyl-aldehyde dehydrogenase